MFIKFSYVSNYFIIYDAATNLFVNALYSTFTSIVSRIFSYISRLNTLHAASKYRNAACVNADHFSFSTAFTTISNPLSDFT